MAEEKELLSVIVLDRPILFRPFNEVQLTMAHRIGKIASAAASSIPDEEAGGQQPLSERSQRALSAGLDGLAQFLTMIQKLAVDPIDQDWLTEQMLAGNLGMAEVEKLIDDLTPAPAKVPAKKKAAVTRAK